MASYPPPNPQQGTIFNPIDWIEPNAGSIDTAYLNEHYCQFPVAQGSMSFAGINNTGTTAIKQNIVMTGTPNVNYIEFPDGTKQYSASSSIDILNDANTWTGVNSFYPNPVQTYGATMLQGITLTNNQSTSTASGDSTIVSYTPSSGTGFEIYSLSQTNQCVGISPQIQLQPDGVKTSLFANGTNGVVQLNALGGTGSKIILQASSGVLLQVNPLINFNNFGTLTGSSTGITSTVQLNTPSIKIGGTSGASTLTNTNDGTGLNIGGALSSGNIYFTVAGVVYGASITPTSGGDLTIKTTALNSNITLDSTAGVILTTNPTISFSSYGTISTNSTNTALQSSADFQVKTQTAYISSTPYGDLASTQAFVQSALQSQGGGDALLAGTNPFTGINTFNGSIPTTTLTNTSNNQFATVAYVKSSVPQFNNISFINNNPLNSTMSPTTVDVSLVYNPAPNNVQWLTGGEFTITWITTGYVGALAILQFNEKPWADFPPANFSSTILGYFTTSSQYYTCAVYWGSSGSVYTMGINIPSGMGTFGLPQGGQVIFNLTSMGSIPA